MFFSSNSIACLYVQILVEIYMFMLMKISAINLLFQSTKPLVTRMEFIVVRLVVIISFTCNRTKDVNNVIQSN